MSICCCSEIFSDLVFINIIINSLLTCEVTLQISEMATGNFGNDKKSCNRNRSKWSKFMKNAKGFAKKGIYGRGTHIENDQYTYYINILNAIKDDSADMENKVNMANNVFEQTAEKEIHLSSNQIVCKVFEYLIGYVDAATLERFQNVFAENFRPICSDRFASHVLQKIVEVSFLRAVDEELCDDLAPKKRKVDLIKEEDYNTGTVFPEGHKQKCSEFVLRVGKFLLNNLEDFVWNSCANHIMRTCILSLSGIYVPKVASGNGGSDAVKDRKQFVVAKEWWDIMKEFPQRLEMWPHFADFPYQEHSSALLGVMCISLKVIDEKYLKNFGRKILIESFLKSSDLDESDKVEDKDDIKEHKKDEDGAAKGAKLPKAFECQSSVRLLETLITVAGPKLLTQIYGMLFTGRIATLAKDKQTNFCVQKLLQHIKETKDFQDTFNELLPHIEELLKLGMTGVVESLCCACLRLGTNQSQMIVGLQTALHVPSNDKEKAKYFFQCLTKLKPYEITIKDESSFVHLSGSLIVQHILKFNKPIYLVNCILNTTPAKLVAVFNTPNGSYITDAFLQSKFIGEKSREKLIRHLQGLYVDLAITRPGSRVIENFFEASNDAQKERIVKELSDKQNLLKGSPYGYLLYKKFRLETYRLSANQWKEIIKRKESKAVELFKDIVA